MRRFVFLAALLAVSAPSLAGDAPYCVYTNGPPQCFYYSIDTCRSAARSFNGMCAPNNQPQQTQTQYQQPSMPQIQPYKSQVNIMGMMQHIQDAGDAGRRRGMEQQEFEARMSLLRAQTEAAQHESVQQSPRLSEAQQGAAAWNAIGEAAMQQRRAQDSVQQRYICDNGDGTQTITHTPYPAYGGCSALPVE